MIVMKSLLTAVLLLILLMLAAWQLGQAGLLAAKAWAAPILIERAWIKGEETGADFLPWPWADSAPTVKIVAPRLDVTRYVLSGDNMRNLAFGPVLQHKENGSIIFGHRDTHFRFLEKLKIKDIIYVHGRDQGRKKWTVVHQGVLSADELYISNANASETLMLITCYPFDGINPNTDLRYVVWLSKA
ncbi:MAG: sortase [Sneathiella sp.]|nr:sortase [Sneathiella sp.]